MSGNGASFYQVTDRSRGARRETGHGKGTHASLVSSHPAATPLSAADRTAAGPSRYTAWSEPSPDAPGHGINHLDSRPDGQRHRPVRRPHAARVGHAALPDRARSVRAGAPVCRRLASHRRAPALPRAGADGQRAGAPRRRRLRRLCRLPRPALERARADEGRHPLRPRRDSRRVRGARDVDDLEVRAAAAPVRRREGRRPLRSEAALAGRAGTADAALHAGARERDRPPYRHRRARHGHERADDGLDDGHLLDAAGARRAGDRDRQARLGRRLGLPARGDRCGGRDGGRARLREARPGARRPELRRPGLRQRGRDRGHGARPPRRAR